MFKLLAVFVAALILAYISEKNTEAITASGQRYSVWKDWAYIALVVILVLFAGLRTNYNDTWNYMNIFRLAPGIVGFFNEPDSLHLLANPLFYLFINLLKMFTDQAQWLIFLTSVFTQSCFLRFIKRYSTSFVFGVFLYFTLGTFALSMAAIKQVLAMAILTLAIPFLEKKKWYTYYLLVFIAMLFHTYAIAFAVLPLFSRRPWKFFTYIFAFALVVLMMNFQEVITTFLDQADEVGKTIADYEVFANNTINVFRLAVYAVPPLISLIFKKWIFTDSTIVDHVLVHMSIISLSFMVMGTQSGANMFGRMANYFEMGTICCLPWMLKNTFTERSFRLVMFIACICFMGFFIYANAINISFDNEYKALNLFEVVFSWL